MAADRDDFSEPDKRLLAERVGFHCSNPVCGVATIWAALNPEQMEYVGVAAHIYSASPTKGPRANSRLTPQQRSSINNGIHLCNKCSREIDTNGGMNHPDEMLRDWKNQAETRQRARGLINNNVPMYRKVNYEQLDTDYKVALACAGLSEKQIKACPRDVNLEAHIQQQLNIANKCVIIGPSGSGKSLVTHQLAELYQEQGLTVLQLNKPIYLMSNGVVALPINIVLIIDDGHILPEHIIDQLFAQATDTTKILMNWNDSVSTDISSLRRLPQAKINEKRQVDLLAGYCRDNKEIIASFLTQMRVDVNPRNYHDTIENRIELAARERSPWMFNYILSEGWKTARQDLDLLKDNNDGHHVLAVIAIFQIVTLDAGISWSTIESALIQYSDDIAWRHSAISQAQAYVTNDNGLIKLKHYRYAERILRSYFRDIKTVEMHSPNVHLLEQLLRDCSFADGHSNLLEFINFNYHLGQYYLNQGSLVTDLTSESITSNTLTRKICIRRIYSLVRFDKTNCLSVLKGNPVIERWIFELKANESMTLFWMLGSLLQAGYKELTVNHSMLLSVFEKLRTAPMSSKGFFAKIFSQLVSYGGEEAKNIAHKIIQENNLELRLHNNDIADLHWHFSETFCHLSWINQSWAQATFEANLETIVHRLNNDFFEAEQDYGEIFKKVFGVISAILGSKRQYHNKLLGKILCSKLDPKKIASWFQKIDYHSIQNYWNFLLFIQMHNAKVLTEITNLLDFSVLKKLYGNDKEIEHHHRCLLQIIYDSNPSALKEYASWLSTQLKEYHINLLLIFPDEISKGLEEGKSLDLKIHSGEECSLYVTILEAILKEGNQELVHRILIENKENFAKAIFDKSQNVDRNKGKIKLILFINSYAPDLIKALFVNSENLRALLKKISILISGSKIEMHHAKLYFWLIEKYAMEEHVEISNLKNRYKSLRHLDLSTVNI